MTEENTKIRGGFASSYLLIITLALIPIIYVLSLGPAIWLLKKMNWSPPPQFVRSFYWPLEWAHKNTFLKEPLDWYVNFFM